MIEQDLHQFFSIDVAGVLDTRSWRWLRTRILGCLNVEGRLARHFAPPEKQQPRGRRR